MVDSDRSTCKQCAQPFSVRRSKHHCRQCGEIFCQPCSAYHSKLNSEGEPDAYGVAWRVCGKCFAGDGRIYIPPDAERPGELDLRLGARQELMSQFEVMKQETEHKRLEQKRKLRDLANLRKKMANVPLSDVTAASKEEKYRVAPSWEDQSGCARCAESFGVFGGGHHCRLCGGHFCKKCSAKTDVDVECMEDAGPASGGAARHRDPLELRFMAVEPHGQVWICTDPEEAEVDQDRPDTWSCETKVRLEPRLGGVRLHGKAGDGERFATKEDLLTEQKVSDKVYTPLKEIEKEVERGLLRLGSLRNELVAENGRLAGAMKLELAKLHHDLQVLLNKYKAQRKRVTELPHTTPKTKRIAAKLLEATQLWFAGAYFSYNEHKKDIYQFFKEDVLEEVWRLHPPKKLGSVYGFVMRLLFEWDTMPLIASCLKGDARGEFELPSGYPLGHQGEIDSALAAALGEMKKEVVGAFLDADKDWKEYADKIKAMTKKPLKNMALLQHGGAGVGGNAAASDDSASPRTREQREDNDRAQLLAEVINKCHSVELCEEWIIGAKAEKCKAALRLMCQLAEDGQRQPRQ